MPLDFGSLLQLGVGGALAYALLRLVLGEILGFLGERDSRAEKVQQRAIDGYRSLDVKLQTVLACQGRAEERDLARGEAMRELGNQVGSLNARVGRLETEVGIVRSHLDYTPPAGVVRARRGGTVQGEIHDE